jgi:hypothetical protein
MTALTDNYEDKRQDGEIISVPVKASTTIYKGAMLVDKGTGYAEPGTDGSGYIFLGVAAEKADNSGSATDGAIRVRVYKTGTFVYNKASAAQTDLDQAMYIHDDCTVGTSSTNSVLAGYCVDVPSSSTIKLRIDLAAK